MKFEKIAKSYGDRCVLNIGDIEFTQNRVYAVIGANGSGKSTFAKVIAGTVKADEAVKKPKVKIGYMPQKSYAFHLSLRNNLRINRKKRKSESDEDALMQCLKIENLASSPAKKLSGGETARMALARLLMNDYELLILDEPTAAMDIESTQLAEKLILDYKNKTGCAVLLITHSIAQAERMADEVLFMHEGELCERGNAYEVLHSPKNEKTKEFINFYSK